MSRASWYHRDSSRTGAILGGFCCFSGSTGFALSFLSSFYFFMAAQARGTVLYIRGCFSFFSLQPTRHHVYTARQVNHTYSRRIKWRSLLSQEEPFAFILRYAFTIEATSFPSALHCCWTVLELNLQDRSNQYRGTQCRYHTRRTTLWALLSG